MKHNQFTKTLSLENFWTTQEVLCLSGMLFNLITRAVAFVDLLN